LSKHTPGPWIEKPDGQGTYEVVENRVESWLQPDEVGLDKYPIDVAGTVMGVTPAMNLVAFGPIEKYNAVLIAAAPDLLAALKAIVSQSPAAPGTELRRVADIARAAIAKAEGGAL
jgi:hypothetical protein